MQLTSEQSAAYDRDGFLLLPNLLDAGEVALLRAEIERVARIKAEEVKRESDDGPPKIMLGLHQPDRAVSSEAMAALVRLPRTLGVARQVLKDEALYLHHTKCNLKTSIEGSAWPWHQDFGSWQLDGIRRPDMTTLMVSLDTAEEINGCLYFLPGSHREGRHDAVYDTSTAYHLYAVPHAVTRERIRKYGPPVAITSKPGDGVIFDCNLLHASGHNLSADNRWQIFLCYNTCANRPEDIPDPRPAYVRGRDWDNPLNLCDDTDLRALARHAA
ncbi:MAG: phytanoyl-CoA dioxygenase family protein [Alphaproteobacteria bacterium]|nr:phytanoyl-CoA dioxygenase family protein [Alphaproteobacteria bacterium]MCB9927966.1 phytanoyl-CoA dioxygenase family protein [Alphaproteobacteria bacterium]